MEKTFKQIEADIEAKGFEQTLFEAAEELQTITRQLGYLQDEFPELKAPIAGVAGHLLRAGIIILDIKNMLKK